LGKWSASRLQLQQRRYGAVDAFMLAPPDLTLVRDIGISRDAPARLFDLVTERLNRLA
jgi:hypothetical protein